MSDGIFSWPLRVYYEDTDAGGVVYHSVYLNYMERTRTEWLRALGVDQSRLVKEQGILFAVARMEIDFRAPARLDDALIVTAFPEKVGRASLLIRQTIVRAVDGVELIRAMAKIGCIGRDFKPARLPDALYALFNGAVA